MNLQKQQKKRDFAYQPVIPKHLLRVGVCGFLCLILGSLVGLSLFNVPTASATTGIESELSFEGKIENSAGTNISDGTYNMEFKIYTGCTNEPTNNTGCTLTWTEDHLVSNSDGVAFTSGTYEVNLGQFCSFGGGACTPSGANDGNTNTAINWDTYPLYLSLQIGNTSSCSPTSNGFTSTCGGDGEMSPYILLTSAPYAFEAANAANSAELGGIASTGFVQTAPTGSQTIQATANATGLIVEQNSGGSYGSDIFDVQGTGGSSDDFLQVTSSAANTGNVTIQGLGSSSTANVEAGGGGSITIGNQGSSTTNTVNIGSTTTNANADAVNINTEAANTGTVTIGGTGNATGAITIGQSTGTNTIAIGGGATANTYTQTVNIGNGVTASGGTLAVNIGTQGASGSTTTVTVGSTQSNDTVKLQAGATSESLGNSGDTVKTSTNTGTAFQIQNAAVNNVFTVSTVTTNLVTNSGFDTNDSNWSTYTGGVLSQDTTAGNAYSGIGALKNVTAAASEGVETSNFTSAIAATTQYQLTFYAKCSSSISTFTIGRDDVSGTNIVDTSTATCNTSWQQYTWHYTTGGTITSPFIYMQTGSGGSNGFDLWIDSVSLVQTTTSGATDYQPGSIYLNGVVSSPAVFQSAANSATYFQIQNSSSQNVVNVSTTNGGVVTLSNSSTTAAQSITQVAEWDNYNAAGLTSLTVSPSNLGDVMMLAVNLSASTMTTGNGPAIISGGGVTSWHYIGSYYISGDVDEYMYEGTVTTTGSTSVSVTYEQTLSTWASIEAQEFSSAYGANTSWTPVVFGTLSNASSANVTYPSLTTTQAGQLYWGYAELGGTGAAGSGCTSGFTCVKSTNGNGDDYVYGSSTSANTAYQPVDTAGQSAAVSYTMAVIMSASYAPNTNSSTAFLIQNSTSNSLLTADTSDMRVIVGAGSIGEATPSLLVLDNGTSSSDPQGEINGAMYYNASMNGFRCGQNGAWVACQGQVYHSYVTTAAITNTSPEPAGTPAQFSTQYVVPINDCQPGVSYHIHASGHLTNGGSTDEARFYIYEGTTKIMQSGLLGTNSTTTGGVWVLDAEVDCVTTTTVSGSGTVTYSLQGGNSVTTLSSPDSAVNVMSTDGGTATWNNSGASIFGIWANWGGSNNTSGDVLYQDTITIQRQGP